MCDPTDWVKDVVSDTLSKSLQKPVENLLGPVTTELGLTLGDAGSLFRFYVSDNLTKVFTKWAEHRKGKPLDSSDIQRVLPLLQGASLQSDGELQERWAALLESTVESNSVLPSFGNTLSQLTAEEARYVNDLWETVNNPESVKYRHLHPEGRFFSFGLMMYVFDSELSEHISAYHGRKHLRRPLSREQQEGIDKLKGLHLIAQDIERLGIIGTSTQIVPGRSKWIETDENEVEIPGESGLNERKFFTPYGESFIKAVKPQS
ncbi:MAG: DUF4393 domain-containing protein [Acidobacteriota bacterium]|nr:DUF4393 domain-containing protein [Acidobacteriota bacterium]